MMSTSSPFSGILQSETFETLNKYYGISSLMQRNETFQCDKTQEFVKSDRPLITLPGNYYTNTYSIRTFQFRFDSGVANELSIECPICHEEFKIIVKPGRIKPKEEAEKEFKKVRSYSWIQLIGGIMLATISIYILIMREVYILPLVSPGELLGFLMFMLIGLIFAGLFLISLGYEKMKLNIHDVDFEYDIVSIVGNKSHSFYRGFGGTTYDRRYHPSSSEVFLF
jgi:hypothetical protein